MADQQPPVIVNPQGKPARAAKADVCPQCGQGKDHRRVMPVFGGDRVFCLCGHEFGEDE